MSPRKTNPTTTRGMIALFERVSAISVKTKKDSGLVTTCVIAVSGKYLTDAAGEVMIGIDASSNIPTEPVAVETRGGWFRKKSIDWDGTFSIEWTLGAPGSTPDVEGMLVALRLARGYMHDASGNPDDLKIVDDAITEVSRVVLG